MGLNFTLNMIHWTLTGIINTKLIFFNVCWIWTLLINVFKIMGMTLIKYLNVRYQFLYEILILYNGSCYYFQLGTLQ